MTGPVDLPTKKKKKQVTRWDQTQVEFTNQSKIPLQILKQKRDINDTDNTNELFPLREGLF